MVAHHVSFMEEEVTRAEKDHLSLPQAFNRILSAASIPPFLRVSPYLILPCIIWARDPLSHIHVIQCWGGNLWEGSLAGFTDFSETPVARFSVPPSRPWPWYYPLTFVYSASHTWTTGCRKRKFSWFTQSTQSVLIGKSPPRSHFWLFFRQGMVEPSPLGERSDCCECL